MMETARDDVRPGRRKNFFFILFFILVLGKTTPLAAASLVAAKYVRIVGQEVVVEISIGEPPPTTLIVIQLLPEQVSVVQARPAIKGSSSVKGELKWLFADLKAGKREIQLVLDRPITIGDLSGEIRYREPGGEMVTIPITK